MMRLIEWWLEDPKRRKISLHTEIDIDSSTIVYIKCHEWREQAVDDAVGDVLVTNQKAAVDDDIRRYRLGPVAYLDMLTEALLKEISEHDTSPVKEFP